MVANWESTEDCSSLHSSSYSSEDGEQFLNEEDFASAVAKAAVMSGLTVVGTTVSDPSPRPGMLSLTLPCKAETAVWWPLDLAHRLR